MKKIVLSLMLLLPLSMVAQEVKIAVVNFMDVVNVMPEFGEMENELGALADRYRAELQSLENDFNRKNSDFMNQQDSLTENIKMMRMQEIQELQGRYENLLQMAQQDTQKTQEEMFAPIHEKVQKAIDQIGDENNYTMIFMMNPNSILYVGKTAVDITDQVKAKLGLK